MTKEQDDNIKPLWHMLQRLKRNGVVFPSASFCAPCTFLARI